MSELTVGVEPRPGAPGVVAFVPAADGAAAATADAVVPRTRRGRAWLERGGVLCGLVLLWELAPRLHVADTTLLPPLSQVLAAGLRLARNGQLANHIGASLGRSLLGFGLAIAIMVPLGLLLGRHRRLARVLDPLLETLRNTAALALLPLFILLLGIGETSKISIVLYTCAWPILLNTISAVRDVDPLLIKSARTLGLSRVDLFRKVIVPASLPAIFTGIRLAGATSLLVLIAAEMVGAKAGLGYLIIYAQYNFQIPEMYVGILTTTLLGLLFNQILRRLERRLTSWKPVVAD
jgi:NitT/TauT family transport system permease protein